MEHLRLQWMEIGVIGINGSHAQPHVARERAKDSVCVIHLHLKMAVSPVLVIDTNTVPVTKGLAKVRFALVLKYE